MLALLFMSSLYINNQYLNDDGNKALSFSPTHIVNRNNDNLCPKDSPPCW